MSKKVPSNKGIVIFHIGAFGGASKRYTNLFLFLNRNNPAEYYYIINEDFFQHIKIVFPEATLNNVFVLGGHGKKNQFRKSKGISNSKENENSQTPFDHDSFLEKLKLENGYSIFRKLYWHLKNYCRQYALFNEIEEIRSEYNINTFMGVFSGILPLYFYFSKKNRPAIVFSNMDSWFYEIHPEEKKYWYRKYYSFNYAFKRCDRIDFLSPFIYNGVKELGIKLNEERVSITPCSFADYSKCFVGAKESLGVVFAARLEINKNPFLFIEAANIILRKFPFVKFYLLGDGQLRQEITELLGKLGLTGIIDFKFHSNPPEVFAETTIFVSLQSTNNYPSQSILEAMACGNAIIATDVGDTRMFVNESNGILITPDLNDLVNAIESLIKNKEMTRQMGLNAREFVLKHHTIEKHADYYSRLLESALSDVNPK